MKLRYKIPDQDFSREMVHPISLEKVNQKLTNTSYNFRFSAAVASLGLRLRNSDILGDYSYDEIYELAKNGRGKDEYGYRSEFLRLVNIVKSLQP